MFAQLLEMPPWSVSLVEKTALMLEGLNDLCSLHYERCAPYRRIIDLAWGGPHRYERLEDIPYLPVSLFKELDLASTPDHSLILKSSGTTGQRQSRIFVDDETAQRQSRALVSTFAPILGQRRLPFLAIDTRAVLTDQSMSARGAGLLGMMKFGARAAFAMNAELVVDKEAIRDFLSKFGDQPFLMFGFTFLVWSKLFGAFEDGELNLSNGILVHSGGWKKLEADKVSNEVFRAALERRFKLRRIYNFYGFVEQIGSVFVEGEDGRLYPPNFTEVVIRDPTTWRRCNPGEEGVIQVLSLLPTSYPGHSVLTEDWGVVDYVDKGVGGRLGQAVRVIGRVPKAELRGCSDVIAAAHPQAA
jgi:hypothetical protein